MKHIWRAALSLRGAFSIVPDPAAPSLVQQMLRAGQAANVGPMAAVAGAIAEFVGEALASPEVIIENGGDLICAPKDET